jgi:hypothetical protein
VSAVAGAAATRTSTARPGRPTSRGARRAPFGVSGRGKRLRANLVGILCNTVNPVLQAAASCAA